MLLGCRSPRRSTGGTNFAFGGAQTGQDLNRLFQRDLGVVIPSLRTQVAAYRLTLADPTLTNPTRVQRAPADALYIVWGGANDLREAVQKGTAGATPASVANDAVNNIATVIRELQSAGAIYFLVPNLPDLGQTPQQVALGPEAVQLGTALSTAFNNTLESTLQHLESTFPVHIARLDIAAHFQEVTANPQNFGVTNVTDACLSGDPFAPGTVCANPDSYIFWDAIGHPTAVAQDLIADFAFMVLPPLMATAGANNPQDSSTSHSLWRLSLYSRCVSVRQLNGCASRKVPLPSQSNRAMPPGYKPCRPPWSMIRMPTAQWTPVKPL